MTTKTLLTCLAVVAGLFLTPHHPVLAQPSSAKPEVYFIRPQDGATVSNPVLVRFGLKNMTVAPAGVEKPGTGHHHLLVDAPLPPLDEPIPNDDNHLHFGKGQTETELRLAPGKHTLQLLMGDWTHIPHNPPVYSQPITIFVK